MLNDAKTRPSGRGLLWPMWLVGLSHKSLTGGCLLEPLPPPPNFPPRETAPLRQKAAEVLPTPVPNWVTASGGGSRDRRFHRKLLEDICPKPLRSNQPKSGTHQMNMLEGRPQQQWAALTGMICATAANQRAINKNSK